MFGVPKGHSSKRYVFVGQRNKICMRGIRGDGKIRWDLSIALSHTEFRKIEISIKLVNTIIRLLYVQSAGQLGKGAFFTKVFKQIFLDGLKL